MDRQASFNAGSTLYACADLSQTGQAYSAVEYADDIALIAPSIYSLEKK